MHLNDGECCLPAIQLRRLQSFQKACVRLIDNQRRFDHATVALVRFHCTVARTGTHRVKGWDDGLPRPQRHWNCAFTACFTRVSSASRLCGPRPAGDDRHVVHARTACPPSVTERFPPLVLPSGTVFRRTSPQAPYYQYSDPALKKNCLRCNFLTQFRLIQLLADASVSSLYTRTLPAVMHVAYSWLLGT